MDSAIKEFSSIYGVPIQYLLAGHLHHNKVEEVGVNQEDIFSFLWVMNFLNCLSRCIFAFMGTDERKKCNKDYCFG